VRFVDVLRMEPSSYDVENLPQGAHKQAFFPCFSATRAALSVNARERTGDPCVKCEVRPLSAAECDFVRRKQKGEATLPVLGGSLVIVTVSERVGDKELDLGPFHRDIIVTSDDSPETHTLTVKGVVMGEIRILGEQQKHRIDFSLFDARQGGHVELVLEADRPTLKLEAESHYPAFLDVKLEEVKGTAGGRQWQLGVTVPPNKAFGRLPPDSVVVLKTHDSPPRRFRIPVAGHGTIK
jgi:hypothetical protein